MAANGNGKQKLLFEESVLPVEEDDQIPVVDLDRLVDLRSSEDEAAKLKMACEEWGFFQLINHGVPNELIKSMKSDIEEFFQPPLEEKHAASQLPGSIEGHGKALLFSKDRKLNWGDMYVFRTQSVASTNTSSRTTVDKYLLELNKVADCLLRWMAKNLGLHIDKLTDLFDDHFPPARMICYPPCPEADEVLGVSPHSDSLGLTFLLEVNEVQGLQINRNGRWIPIKTISGALLVNIGDILEILSNGRYKSIEHRVTVNPQKERVSIVAFHAPKSSVMIGPLPELVEGSEEKYKTLSFESFTKLIVSNPIVGKSLLDLVKLK